MGLTTTAPNTLKEIMIKYSTFCRRSPEPGIKGNTATGATKPAIVETGAKIMVPLFVNQGDKIKIDTRTGEYTSRA